MTTSLSEDGRRSSSVSARSLDEWLGGSEDSCPVRAHPVSGGHTADTGAGLAQDTRYHRLLARQSSSNKEPPEHTKERDFGPRTAVSLLFDWSSGSSSEDGQRPCHPQRSVGSRIRCPSGPESTRQTYQSPDRVDRVCLDGRYDSAPSVYPSSGGAERPVHRLTYTVQNVPKCRRPIVVRRQTLCRQSAVPGPPSPAASPRPHCSIRLRPPSPENGTPVDSTVPATQTVSVQLRQASLNSNADGGLSAGRYEPLSGPEASEEGPPPRPPCPEMTEEDLQPRQTRRLLPPVPHAAAVRRRRWLPATPQSSVESAPAALGRRGAPSPAASSPCLAAASDTEPTPAGRPGQYFRYSHLLIFPLQTLDGPAGLRQWRPPSSEASPEPSSKPSSEPSSKLSPDSSPERSPPSRVLSQPRESERSEPSPPAVAQPSAEVSKRPKRHILPLKLTKSLPSILIKEPEDGSSKAASVDANSPAPAATRQARPSLCGYDPYDPYRPVRRKRPRSPPVHKHRTRSRSLFNLEWKLLKALERRAFQPPLRAWRSGIDVTSLGSSSSAPSLSTNGHLLHVDSVSNDERWSSGQLEVAGAYDRLNKKLTVRVVQARGVLSRRESQSYTQVELALLPEKKQIFLSKLQYGDNPRFNQTFVFHNIQPEALRESAVRLRLLASDRLRRHQTLGEAVLPCTPERLQRHTSIWLSLRPHVNSGRAVGRGSGAASPVVTSAGSARTLPRWGAPGLLLGLQYSRTTGRLAAEVVKGSHFRSNSGSRAPDTYVRLLLVSSSGSELASGKTSVRRAQINPLFRETLMFQLPLFQFSDVSLIVSVYNKRTMRKRDLIGWFGLGHSSTSSEEHRHWADARDAQGVQICRWHLLSAE
ncbi:rabphilin-3A-like isoform X2 [Amphibalanus amphitrite]|nr:rabphilin-3A-like isoform X2 [Amphibalanus amphitrite]